MNDFGNLAYSIVKYDFKEDASRFPISYVSGWLETNLGELNAVTNQEFSVVSGNIYPSGLDATEDKIFRKLYTIHYYNKAAREVLRGVVWSNGSAAGDDWISIKEGDSSIQRTSKNSISRSLTEMARGEKEDLDKLIYQYNLYKSSPSQVAGEDGFYYPLDHDINSQWHRS
jgi:hypothetical protein